MKQIKRLFKLSLLLLLLSYQSVGAEARLIQEGDYDYLSYKKYRFDNGLTVLLVPKSVNTALVEVLYNVGSQEDPNGLEGLAHLTEHLMFHKPEHFREVNYFHDFSARLGDVLHGATGTLETDYYHKYVPSRYLERMIWLEAQRMGYMDSAINPVNMGHEKRIVIREILEKQEYLGSSYQRSSGARGSELHRVAGSPESVSNIEVDDIKRFYQAYYRPNNATLLVAGDFDEAQVLQWIDQYFSPIQPYKFARANVTTIDCDDFQLNSSQYMKYVSEELETELNVLYMLPPLSCGTSDYAVMSLVASALEDIIDDLNWQESESIDIEADMVINGVDADHPHFELIYYPDHDHALSATVSLHEALLARLARLTAKDIALAIEKAKMVYRNDYESAMDSWRVSAYYLLHNEVKRGHPENDLLELESYAAISVEDALSGIQKWVIDQPSIYQSIVETEAFAYKPENMPWYEPSPREAVMSVVDQSQPLPPKLTEAGVYPPLPDLMSAPAVKIHAPSIWNASLANQVQVLGIEHEAAKQTSARLMIGKPVSSEDSEHQIVVARLAKLFLNNKLENLLEEEAYLQADAALSIAFREGEEIYLSVNARSESFFTVLEDALVALQPSEGDQALFVEFQQSLAEDIPRESYQDIVDARFFSEDDRLLGLRNREYYSIYPTLPWSEVRDYISTHIMGQLGTMLVVSDLPQTTLINHFESMDVLAQLRHVIYPLTSFTSSISLQTGLHVIMDEGENVELTVVSALPNVYDQARYLAYNRMLTVIYSRYFLNHILREQLGMTYSPNGFPIKSDKFVQFWTEVIVKHGDVSQALAVIHNLYKEFGAGQPIASDMLETQQAGFLSKPLYDFSRHADKLNYLTRVYSYAADRDYMQDWYDALNHMTAETINDWANAHMDPDELIMIVDNATEQEVPAIREFAASIDYPLYFYERSDETSELTLIEAMSPSTE